MDSGMDWRDMEEGNEWMEWNGNGMDGRNDGKI